MTPNEKMIYQREAIRQALTTAGLASVLYNKDDIPKELPAAIVILRDETGKNGTSRRFTDTDLNWIVYLIVNAQGVSDPDAEIYRLKESFRSSYLEKLGRDLPRVEYYTSRIDGARLVRVAMIELLRSGTGAGA